MNGRLAARHLLDALDGKRPQREYEVRGVAGARDRLVRVALIQVCVDRASGLGNASCGAFGTRYNSSAAPPPSRAKYAPVLALLTSHGISAYVAPIRMSGRISVQ
jgi:hypothetical protein